MDVDYIKHKKYYIENKDKFRDYTNKYLLKKRILKKLSELNIELSKNQLDDLILYRQLHPYSNIIHYLKLKRLIVV